ncbi:MAG: hypothetical protein H6R17_1510 [Proteobacteria bacterium]|nr:hypothetical protein [Pseudomonadota bacterium]
MLRVAINILNWNRAADTLCCIAALSRLSLPPELGVSLEICVLDNGSSAADRQTLADGLRDTPVRLEYSPLNLGFAGGHNRLLRESLAVGVDFVWVLNNDAIADADCLAKMLRLIVSDETCGAVSPLIRALHDRSHIDFCGAVHDWTALESIKAASPQQGAEFEKTRRPLTWLHGAAVMLRCRALRQVGLFDEDYFAYYEDNDLGARLAAGGFSNRVAFDASVSHFTTLGAPEERPTYFHYLMARNALLFWLKNCPDAWRRPIRYRVVQQSIVAAQRLENSGQHDKADACLLGAWDGLLQRIGPPRLERPVPWPMRLISRVFLR